MTPDLWQRLKPLFEQAIDLPREERAAFVDQVTSGGDELLCRELEALLRAHEQTVDTLDRPLVLAGLHIDGVDWLPVGHLIMGRFEIVRHLGSGGMGDVYEALDRDLGKGPGRIALKTVRRSIAGDPAALARFKSEVVLARRVGGPHVCRIHELYVPGDARAAGCRAFLTMEYLEGTTLADRLESLRHGPDAALPLAEASAIAAQLCEALQAIHEAGVIHRDLKPRNIMLTKHDDHEKVVVMDFGLARERLRYAVDAETGLTLPGMVMGTPDYMAPEQLEGKEASAATDIYALGLILYEMVTGRQPYASSTPLGAAVRRAHRPERASSLRRGLPTAWDDVIECCTRYEPEERFQSAREVIEELRKRRLVVWRFEQGQRIAVTPRASIVAASLLLLLLAGTGWYRYTTRPPKPPPEMARRWYEKGKAALRRGSYLEATYALGQATSVDSSYAMAHAGLAEAWSELDFSGQAQREMLIASAPEQIRDLERSDRLYIEAVRKTLVRDYSAAAQSYEAILKDLPDNSIEKREAAYVDLGRAYEKAGKVAETIEKYEQAAKMMPDDPAPFLRLGILKSRERDSDGGERDFDKADEIYKASGSREGQAEVAYQRGYAANVAANSERSKTYLNESLRIAKEIGSAQMEARSLSQLSDLEYESNQNDAAIGDAGETLKIAQDNGLDYWVTDAKMRLANAYLGKSDVAGHFEIAEGLAQDSLRSAMKDDHPRLIADAQLTLASIRDQLGIKRDEQSALATEALSYFKDYGFLEQAADASTLLVRAQDADGHYREALNAGMRLLEFARKTHSRGSMLNAEETVGGVAADLEDYPTALLHFENALTISKSIHQNEIFEALHCASMLWRLGRYEDFDNQLTSLTAEAIRQSGTAIDIQMLSAESKLSQGLNHDALFHASQNIRRSDSMPATRAFEFKRIEALAEAREGALDSAKRDSNLLLGMAEKEHDDTLLAEARLVNAEVLQKSGEFAQAKSLAELANVFFTTKNTKESEWLSVLAVAQAAHSLGDDSTSKAQARKGLDILLGLEQSWGSPVFQPYAARYDYRAAKQQLMRLAR